VGEGPALEITLVMPSSPTDPALQSLKAEIHTLETSLRDSEARNASLSKLVEQLLSEADLHEARRVRERRLRHSPSGVVAVPREAVDQAREMLEEGAHALVAAHEHTLRLVEMRVAAMGEQLARCASALPASGEPRGGGGGRSAASPSASWAPKSGLCEPEEEWAEPTAGGLCLDSLPLHVPSAGAHGGAFGGAFGIHGRRPAISTTPWSANPATLASGWWEEDVFDRLADDKEGMEGDTAPPSPTAEGSSANALGCASEGEALSVATPGSCGTASTVGSGGAGSPRRMSTSLARPPSVTASHRQRWAARRQLSEKRGVDLFEIPWDAVDEHLRSNTMALPGWDGRLAIPGAEVRSPCDPLLLPVSASAAPCSPVIAA
jgi:hypothetical protein